MSNLSSIQITSDIYRGLVKTGELCQFRVAVRQTDLLVSACTDMRDETESLVRKFRRDIEDYIELHPYFERALVPVGSDPSAPDIVKTMIESSARAGVGPMASVAGAVAEHVGMGLLAYSKDIIVENGGDVFICFDKPAEMLLLAESSDIYGLRIGIPPFSRPGGVCTSSGRLGHSLSFGNADAVMVVGHSASFADAAATAVANIIKKPDDIRTGIKMAEELGASGVVILAGGYIGAWGSISLLN